MSLLDTASSLATAVALAINGCSLPLHPRSKDRGGELPVLCGTMPRLGRGGVHEIGIEQLGQPVGTARILTSDLLQGVMLAKGGEEFACSLLASRLPPGAASDISDAPYSVDAEEGGTDDVLCTLPEKFGTRRHSPLGATSI